MAVIELSTDRRLLIAKHARGALLAADALGKTPTPLDDVTAALELHQPEDLLHLGGKDVPAGLLHRVSKLAGKVLGGLAIRERKVFIDMTQDVPKRRFTQGHELGHAGLPWQLECYYGDDSTTLDPDTRDELEAEANAFSAALLFNLDSFTEQAHSFQPGLAAPLHLAGTFQTSRHAAIRRYVEDAPRPCALLVLGRYLNHPGGRPSLVVRQVIESGTFRGKYGPAAECFPSRLPIDVPGIGRDAHAALQGAVSIPLPEGRTTAQTPRRGSVNFDYEIFFNRYQVFVLIVPVRLKIFNLQQRLRAGSMQ